MIEKSRQFSLQDLNLAALYLTPEQLMIIKNRLYEDFNSNRSGFPDLFLVKDDVPFFVEVKRKKERIAPNQIQWLDYLHNTVGTSLQVGILLIKKASPHSTKGACFQVIVTARQDSKLRPGG